jgi:cytochrome c556
MKKATVARLIAAVAVVTAAYTGIHSLGGTAQADSLQADIDARRALMKEIGAQAKAIYAVVDAKSGDLADMQKRALLIQADAGKIPPLFPAGTSADQFPGKTHAKPEIWQDFDGFKQHAATLGTEAGKLADAAKSGDMAAFSAQFDTMGEKACGGCHKQFRLPLQ